MKRFLMAATCVIAMAVLFELGAAYAQNTNNTSPQIPAPVVAPAPANQNNAPAETQAPAMTAPNATAVTQTPPPRDAIITAQGGADIRADKIIGATVYNPDGQQVGKVRDVLFDANGKVKGVILNVGGILGIGAKPVGLQWKELEVQPSNDVVKVNYTKEQLEAAPAFQLQDEMPSSGGSAPAPAQTPSQ